MKNLRSKYLHGEAQDGINMVDLMMWLVIAALLLAAAIQGIGYYQKAAYLNNMKSDAHNAGTNTLAVSANNKGVIDLDTVNQGVADTQWSSGMTTSVETPSEAGRKPYIRVSNPAVDDKEVIYLFDSCGDSYAIGANIIPKGGTPTLQACGVAASAPSGSGGTSGSSGSTVLTANPNNTTINAHELASMNDIVTLFSDTATVDGWNNGTNNFWDQTDVNTFINLDADTELVWDWDNIYYDLSASDPTFASKKSAMDAAQNAWWNNFPVSDADRQAVLDTTLPVYQEMVNSNATPYRLSAAPSFPNDFTDKTINTLNNTYTFRFALPAGMSPTGVTIGDSQTVPNSTSYARGTQTMDALDDGSGNKYLEYSFDYNSSWQPGDTIYYTIYAASNGGDKYFKTFAVHVVS